MMDRIVNSLRNHSSGVDASIGQPRWAIVESYDGVNHLAKVTWQPEGVTTSWLPILSPSAGPSWGLMSALKQGQMVLAIPDLGDDENGVIMGCGWSTTDMPPQPPTAPGGDATALQSGEHALVHSSGTFMRFNNDGSVFLNTAGNLNATVTGTLTATSTGNATVSTEGNLIATANGNASIAAAGGLITLTATEVKVVGALYVTGDITYLNGMHGTVGALQVAYDAHGHPYNAGTTPSTTSTTNMPV